MKRTLGAINAELIITLLATATLLGALVYIFPTSALPSPGGKYGVGLKFVELEDGSRLEPFLEGGEKRRMIADIWYPSLQTQGRRRSELLKNPTLYINSLANNYNLPAIIFQYIRAVKTNSYIEANPVDFEGGAPVVLLSPGTPALAALYFSFAEYLASRGYVVVGVEHPYGAAVVEFADGYKAFFSEERILEIADVETFQEGVRFGMKLMDEDLSFLIGELTRLNGEDDLLKGLLDMTKLGLFGHSGGGGAVHFTAMNDDRVKALVSFDPALFIFTEEEISKGARLPTLIIETEEWKEREESGNISEFVANSTAQIYHLMVSGATHADFAMLHHLSPLAHWLGFSGTFMPNGGEEYLFRTIDSFFRYVLEGNPKAEFLNNLLSRRDVRLLSGN